MGNKIKIMLVILFCLITFTLSSQNLHLYGGKDHDVYLGCLTCNDYSSSSVWNEYTEYGNSYNTNSIWNEYGDYGNEYSNYSPWNESATYPPVVVDKDGVFYGYFTVNKYKDKRTEFKTAMIMYKYYDIIRDNVNVWYKKIFEQE